jgi:release factor glutamine methyltransferase
VATLGEIYLELSESFSLLPHIANPREKAALVLDLACGYSREDIVLQANAQITPERESRLRDILRQAESGVPLAYAIGEWYFAGRRFFVTRDVLIPRPDTETLLIMALLHCHGDERMQEILEIGVGSGAVIISAACELAARKPRCVGTDASSAALRVAQRNVEAHDRPVEMRCGSLFEPIRNDERFSIIISNPPYVPAGEEVEDSVRGFEPEGAYRVPEGLPGTHYHRLIAEGARMHLHPGGMLAMEVGAVQANDVAGILSRAGFSGVHATNDLGGIERVVSGIWRG